jgi:hypothetical protein
MKFFFLIITLILSLKAFSQVAIGTTTPHSAAILDLTSSNKGFLPPRMTAAQRNEIVSPVAGLEIWCTDCGTYGEAQIYNGSIWTNLAGGTVSVVIAPLVPTSLGAVSPVGIGTNSPNAAAALELRSTTKGFLTARMTFTQRNAMEPTSTAAGLQVWCTDCNSGAGELSIFNGAYWTNSTGAIANMAPPIGGNAICDGSRPTVVKDVTHIYNGITYTWMDRNLGASRAATTYDDYMAFGCRYQWGRGNDGHASIVWTSSTAGTPVNGVTTVTSSSTTAPNALFINAGNTNLSWMTTPPNPETRWQGVNGVNNPCPAGYRLPVGDEFNALVSGNYNTGTNATSWANATVRLPVGGCRNNTGSLSDLSNGYYHQMVGNCIFTPTTLSGSGSYTDANHGRAVRCIKN